MLGFLTLHGAIVSNTASGSVPLSIWLYDENHKLLLALKPGAVSTSQIGIVDHASVLLTADKRYYFPNRLTLDPGEVVAFTPAVDGLKNVTDFREGKIVVSFDMITTVASTAPRHASTALKSHLDPYLGKVLTLAKFHKKLTKVQFDIINNGNTNIQLQGSATAEGDQQIYDETVMLATAVNTQLGAIANAAHLEEYDIGISGNQIKMINGAANGLFNWYYSHMGAFETTVNMSTSIISNTYKTSTIKLDALTELFKTLALPEAKLLELNGAVDAFVTSMSNLSSQSSDKGLKNVMLVNFFSIQPPMGSPTLDRIAKMRMFYIQFEEATSEWSNSCASHSEYKLDTNLFTLDVELNRQICHLTYDHNIALVLANAELSLDEMGAAGVSSSSPKLKIDGPSPIGPAPVSY